MQRNIRLSSYPVKLRIEYVEFRYLSAYKVQGVSQMLEDPDVVLVERPDLGLKATITGDVDSHCYLLDRPDALAQMMLTSQIDAENFDEVLNDTIHKIQKTRKQKLEGAAALVIEIRGEVDARIEQFAGDFGEFAICWNAVDQDAIRQQYRHDVTALISSLQLASSGGYEFFRVAEGTYLIDEKGKIIHSRSPTVGGGTVYVSNPLNQRVVESTRRYADALVGDRDLQRVRELFVQSLDIEADRFRTFVFGWTALEMFIRNVFSSYKQDLVRSGTNVPSTSRYSERVARAIEDGNYPLLVKFAIITAVLINESNDIDVGEFDSAVDRFKDIKNDRNKFYHEQDISEGFLPNVELQSLLAEYLRRHVNYSHRS